MNWKSEDSAQFRDYLQKSGFKLKAYLQSRIPRCDGKTIEEVALQAKYKEGFESVLKEIDDIISFKINEDDASNGNFTTM
jgi:soluble cytochrome b562